MFLPRTCVLCGRPGPSPCGRCAPELERAPSLLPPAGVERCTAVLAYEGAGRELVARLKYRNARSSVSWLATAMAALLDRDDVDVVTWIPTSAERRHARGFDQAQLLARLVARRLGRPCRPLLRRLPGPPQTGRSLVERRTGPHFVARPCGPERVLLVDDVITTGSTITAAALALRGAGVRHVQALAGARTPLKRALAAPEKS